jgi:hypothetical protein
VKGLRSPGEQLLLRDHLRRTGRTASLIGAYWVTATAGGYLAGIALAHLIVTTSKTIDHLRERKPTWRH